MVVDADGAAALIRASRRAKTLRWYSRRAASSVRSLLFSDIEGSTELLRLAGSRYPELLNIHRRIVRDELQATSGIEHGTEGDSFFLSFDSPTDALATPAEPAVQPAAVAAVCMPRSS